MTALLAALLATILFGSSVEGRAASLVANINVGSQTMTVSRSGQVLYRWSVSTARKGYFTPRGTYRPQWTARMWYSRKYDMSPMPYAVFFHGGYAIHGTGAVRQLGRPASHGCVRLQDPRGMAAAVLGTSVDYIADKLKKGHSSEKVTRDIQVYVAYFTAWPDTAGKVEYFGDVYDRDMRLKEAIDATESVRLPAS